MTKKYKRLILVILVLVKVLIVNTAVADIVAYYPFNEGIGVTIEDVSGGHNGTMLGSVQWIESRSGYGKALHFSGTYGAGHVRCGTWNPSEKTGELSVAFWVRWDGGGDDWQGIVTKRNDWAVDKMMWQIEISKESQQIEFSREACKPESSGRVLPKDEWTHVAITFDGTNAVYYINGEINAQEKFSFGTKSDSWIFIGASGTDGTNTFHGAIDEVCIFNNALGKDDVIRLYKMGGNSFVSPTLSALFESVHDIEERTPREEVAFFEKKIIEYERWEKENPKLVGARSKSLASDLYFLLAKAKKNANAPARDIAESYMKSALASSKSQNYVSALLWLYNNLPAEDYIKFVRQSASDIHGSLDNTRFITEGFESSKSWDAFKLFLDAVFSEIDDSKSFAGAIYAGLKKDGLWAHNFLDYCRGKPKLAERAVQLYEEIAEENIQEGEFLKAAEIYRDISEQYSREQNKALYKMKAYECFFEGGEYNMVPGELDAFIEKNRGSNNILLARAMTLKGRIYMQLGETGRALNIFSKIAIDCPESRELPEAGFFIGYCNMLDGNFEEAREALDSVIKNYPQSSYASKAYLCIKMIDRKGI